MDNHLPRIEFHTAFTTSIDSIEETILYSITKYSNTMTELVSVNGRRDEIFLTEGILRDVIKAIRRYLGNERIQAGDKNYFSKSYSQCAVNIGYPDRVNFQQLYLTISDLTSEYYKVKIPVSRESLETLLPRLDKVDTKYRLIQTQSEVQWPSWSNDGTIKRLTSQKAAPRETQYNSRESQNREMRR